MALATIGVQARGGTGFTGGAGFHVGVDIGFLQPSAFARYQIIRGVHHGTVGADSSWRSRSDETTRFSTSRPREPPRTSPPHLRADSDGPSRGGMVEHHTRSRGIRESGRAEGLVQKVEALREDGDPAEATP